MSDEFERERQRERGQDRAGAAEAPADDGQRAAAEGFTEADILRDELAAAREEVSRLSEELAEAKDRHLRSRAEFDTFRRRMAGEVELAKEAGADSVILPILKVFDDLERALAAAAATDDPSTIVPGVRAVRDGLLRDLGSLGITHVGSVGDAFDPELHEALTVVPPTEEVAEGNIAQVFETGFKKGERLIRPAKVVVAKSGTGN